MSNKIFSRDGLFRPRYTFLVAGGGVLKWFRWCQTGPYGTLLCNLYGFSFRNGSGKSLLLDLQLTQPAWVVGIGCSSASSESQTGSVTSWIFSEACGYGRECFLILGLNEADMDLSPQSRTSPRTTSNMESLDIVKACVGDDHNDACKGFRPLQKLNLSESEKESLVVNLLGAEAI